MTRKKWSFLFAVCLAIGLMGCGQKNNQVDTEKNNELGQLGKIQVISREEGSGTRDAFATLAGFSQSGVDGVDKTSKDAKVVESMDAVIEEVQNQPSAIGYVSAGIKGIENVKTLKIDGKNVSDETGKYPLSRSFYLAYQGNLNDVEQDFLTYVGSAGQKIVGEQYEAVAKNETFLSNQAEGTIQIEGSTSMASLVQRLADEYMKLNAHALIQVTATDSTKGLNNVMSGKCDLAMSSRDLKDYEKELLNYNTVAKDKIAVIVNQENPLSDMTLYMLKNIYTGGIKNWEELQ